MQCKKNDNEACLLKKIINYLLIISCLTLTACKVKDPDEDKPQEQKQDSISARETLLAGKADLSLSVVDESKANLSNVVIKVAGQSYTSDANGKVNISDLPYGNHALMVQQNGYFAKAGVIVNQPNYATSQVQLETKAQNSKSLIFAGDTMFGRRYLDPSLSTMGTNIPDVKNALIRPETAGADSVAITADVAELFLNADFASVNFESPVTSNPSTVHPTKEFSFFSLPDSLQGLSAIGVDYLGLGNNHVYDYLQSGLEDTLIEVANAGFLHSGAGINDTDALAPVNASLGDINLTLFAATSITGDEHEFNYVAEQSKGGAADLTNANAVNDTLQALDTNNFIIAQMHGGDEYSYSPTSYIDGRFQALSSQNTDLLIAHHPHVAQGFAVYNDIPAVLGLGNFVFDQPRLDTLLGVAVMIDLNADTQTVNRAFAYPIYIEDYKPRFTTGFLSNYLVRRLAEFSDDSVTLIPRDNYAEVYFSKDQATKRTSQVTVTLDSSSDIIDLRQYAPSSAAYLSNIEVTSGELSNSILGRDIMVFGDFEDWDNDSEAFEVSRWDHTSDSVFPCTDKPYAGIQALCSSRDEFDNTPSIIPFRHTMRVMELIDENGAPLLSKDFSLYGYLQSENGGKLESLLTYTTEIDDLTFSENEVVISNGGDNSWQVFSHDFSLPSDDFTLGPKNLPPRGIKLQFRQYAPSDGEAITRLDNIAMITWQNPISLENKQWQTSKMHGFDFLKVSASNDTSIKLTFTLLD